MITSKEHTQQMNNNLATPVKYLAKRLFDYTVGTGLLIIFFIPMSIVFILLWVTSKEPILKQERIGLNGKPFICYKFRTMCVDAEDILNDLLVTDREAKIQWDKYRKLKSDPRVTRLGRFLRKTSLDELPQIFNVLKGEMSIIGPRPYLPSEWDLFKEFGEVILSIHPGITGLWQVSGRNDKAFEERISLDVFYARHWSFKLNVIILLKTMKVVIKQEGVY